MISLTKITSKHRSRYISTTILNDDYSHDSKTRVYNKTRSLLENNFLQKPSTAAISRSGVGCRSPTSRGRSHTSLDSDIKRLICLKNRNTNKQTNKRKCRRSVRGRVKPLKRLRFCGTTQLSVISDGIDCIGDMENYVRLREQPEHREAEILRDSGAARQIDRLGDLTDYICGWEYYCVGRNLI